MRASKAGYHVFQTERILRQYTDGEPLILPQLAGVNSRGKKPAVDYERVFADLVQLAKLVPGIPLPDTFVKHTLVQLIPSLSMVLAKYQEWFEKKHMFASVSRNSNQFRLTDRGRMFNEHTRTNPYWIELQASAWLSKFGIVDR